MKKRHYLFLFYLFICVPFYAQIYLNENRSRRGISVVDLDNCSYESLDSEGFRKTFHDIALHPDGRMFAVTNQSNDEIPYNNIIIELDMKNSTIKDTLPPRNLKRITSFYISESGLFFVGYNFLHSYDDRTGQVIEYGRLPSSDRLFGDWVTYQDRLIGTTTNSRNQFEYKIYDINLDNPNNSELLYDFTDTPYKEYAGGGVTTYWSAKADGEKRLNLLLGGRIGGLDDEDYSHLSIFAPDARTFEVLCDSMKIRMGNEVIWGMTSEDEFRQNPYLRLDLDRDNSSGRFIDHFIFDSLCVTSFPVADEDVRILTDYEQLDSLVIWVKQGQRHIGQEQIGGTFSDRFIVEGNYTNRLVLHNNGTATHADFEAALREMTFQITADEVTDGQRELWALLYKDGVPSDEARTFLDVKANIPAYAGRDTSISVCESTFYLDLHPYLGAGITKNGYWQPALASTGYVSGEEIPVLRPHLDTADVYSYIAQSGNCPADTASITLNILPEPDFFGSTRQGFTSQVYICPNDTFYWDVTIPRGTSYYWYSGQAGYSEYGESVRPITQNGFHTIDMRDSNNCNWLGTIYLFAREDSIITTTENVYLCKGETFAWQGQTISTDTLLTQQISNPDGCDSLLQIQVQYQNDVVIERSYEFCSGESAVIEGVAVERDTSFCVTYTRASACDSIICSGVQFYPKQIQTIQDTICDGQSYSFNGRLLTAGGVYQQIIPKPVCDSIIELQLVVEICTQVENVAPSSYITPNLLERGRNNFYIQPKAVNRAVHIHLQTLQILDAQGKVVYVCQDASLDAIHWMPQTAGLYFFSAVVVEDKKPKVVVGKVVVQ